MGGRFSPSPPNNIEITWVFWIYVAKWINPQANRWFLEGHGPQAGPRLPGFPSTEPLLFPLSLRARKSAPTLGAGNRGRSELFEDHAGAGLL